MAGKRQHYIPQFLQRGFIGGYLDGAEHTWLHRRGVPSKLVGIRHVGVGEHFYSKRSIDGSPTLDDHITLVESPVFQRVQKIRENFEQLSVDSSEAADLVAHLSFRTAHVRSVMTQAASRVLDHVADHFSNDERMRDALGVDHIAAENNESTLIGQALSKLPLGLLGAPPQLARRVIAFFVRENFDQLSNEVKPEVAKAISGLQDMVPGAIREAHRKVLGEFDLRRWSNALKLLVWRTQKVSGAILPDCVALAREADGAYMPLHLCDLGALDCVVLPISDDLLLIGSKDGDEVLSIEVVNQASALCSDNFFISREPGHGSSHGPLIGQRCAHAISTRVDEAISEATNKRSSSGANAPLDTSPFEMASTPSSFSLSCAGFGDEMAAARLGEIVREIVLELGREMPLSSLDGVTFAADYREALKSLDPGADISSESGSQPRAYGRGVAKCLSVEREGKRKEHIVFDAEVAYGLLQRTDASNTSIHLLVNMLAHVAHHDSFEARLSGGSAPTDDVCRLLHRCVSSAPGMYYAARRSAFADPGAGQRYAALTMDSYKSAREVVRSTRLAYRIDNDLDALMSVALPSISFVLEHAAQWLGHRDGLPDPSAYPDDQFLDCLKDAELDRWLELFGRDLWRLYDGERGFTAENIFALGRHAERLLWTVQICPWPTDEGGVYISVPMGEDARELPGAPSE